MRRFLAVLILAFLSRASFAASESSSPKSGQWRTEGRVAILTPSHALTEADEAALAAEGITVKHALNGGRYLARVRENASLRGDALVVSLEPLTAERKIDRSAWREAASGKTEAEVNVVFQRDVPFQDALQAVLAVGGTTQPFTFRYLPAQRIEARIPPSSLRALATDERVFAIAGPRNLRVTGNNATSAATSHVTEVQAAPYGLTGQGVVVSLFELAKIQSTHLEFGSRVHVDDSVSGGSSGDARHGTHVAGTIGAAGVRADAKGMAPGVSIYQFCVKTGGNQCSGLWLTHKEDDLAPLGVIADNNSWGYVLGWESGSPAIWNDQDIYYGAYDLIVGAPLDKISNEQGVLFIHSAGNDGSLPSSLVNNAWKEHHHVDENGDEIGSQTFCVSQNGSGTDCPVTCNGVGTPCEKTLHLATTPFGTMGVTASAKNVVAVGAVDANGLIASYSSRGPARDGRVKPDLVARGGVPNSGVLSTVPTDSYSSQFWGTSMSSPVVTGIAALLTEQWHRTFAGAAPKPAQLKALLIAGARDLGNPGPDYTYGFGLADAKNSVDLILDDGARGDRIRNYSFAQGQAVTQQELAVVVSATQDLRVVLDWPDPEIALPPGSDEEDIAAVALVNDLDLKVIDPNGVTHLPWTLDKNQFTANATRGVNTVDNVEVVDIANATAGTYRIVATGTRVTEGPQTAVLVTNARAARPCFDVQETSASNNTAETAYLGVTSGSKVYGGICSSTDVDFYKFTATKTGPVTVSVTTGDTALRVTLTGNGISSTQDVPANSVGVLNTTSSTAPNVLTLKIEPVGSLGAEPQYNFTATFGVQSGARRRSIRG